MKIAVLFGGDSMERDVSVASAAQVVGALRSRGHDVLAVDSGRGRLPPAEEKKLLAGTHRSLAAGAFRHRGPSYRRVDAGSQGVDLVFVALHGGSGEDGTIQSLLDLAEIPVYGQRQTRQRARLGQGHREEAVSRRRRADTGLADGSGRRRTSSAATLGFPLIVKPNGQGSTVGLTLVQDAAELAPRSSSRAVSTAP